MGPAYGELKAEGSVSAKGSEKSQKFLFSVTPLPICIKLYAKGMSLGMVCRKDKGCLEIRTPVLSGPHTEAGGGEVGLD